MSRSAHLDSGIMAGMWKIYARLSASRDLRISCYCWRYSKNMALLRDSRHSSQDVLVQSRALYCQLFKIYLGSTPICFSMKCVHGWRLSTRSSSVFLHFPVLSSKLASSARFFRSLLLNVTTFVGRSSKLVSATISLATAPNLLSSTKLARMSEPTHDIMIGSQEDSEHN